MAENMIDLNGLVHVWSKVKTLTDNCVKASDLATVATSGSYNDLSDKPTIPVVPTNVSAFINDAGYLTQHQSLDGYAKKSDVAALMSTKLGITATAYAATRDGAGNNIVDTYAKKTDITNITVDEELSDTSMNPVQNKVINAALNSKADSSMLSDYLPLAGGVCTGGVSAPNFRTGTGATNYFQCQKFRGEGDANAYYHAVDFGYSGHDSVDFYEYDPNWRFYKCTTGTKSGAVLVGNINENGWNGGAVLSGAPTAPTAVAGTNTTQIATTAFVQTAVSSKVDASTLATVATTGDYNNLTNKPSIPAAYTLPTASSSVLGGVKIGSNISVLSGVISLTRANVTGALGYTPPASDTTYGDATTTSSGLMSSTDKVKLNGIANNANYYIHPPTHPASMISGLATVATSGNYNDLANKPGDATTSSAGLMSAADKAKLDKVDADVGGVKLIIYS